MGIRSEERILKNIDFLVSDTNNFYCTIFPLFAHYVTHKFFAPINWANLQTRKNQWLMLSIDTKIIDVCFKKAKTNFEKVDCFAKCSKIRKIVQ